MANQAQNDDERATVNLEGGSFIEQLRRLVNNEPAKTDFIDNTVRTILTNTANGSLTVAEATTILTGALTPDEVKNLAGGALTVDAAFARARRSRYQNVAYADSVRSSPSETPEADVGLTRLVRYAEGASPENDSPTFLLDAVVWIQGVNVSGYIVGDISVSATATSGTNELNFVLANDNERFVWTERNLASIYGTSAISANAEYVQDFLSGLSPAEVQAFNRASFEGLSSADADVSFDAIDANPALLKALSARAFTQDEYIKQKIFEYKANPMRNPPIRNPKNTICFARYDLAPGRTIFDRMDPIRVFTLYPFRAAGSQYEADRPELWIPEFTGYVETRPLEDDDIRGHSTVSISCTCIRSAILRRMRLGSDIATGIENPLDELGFRSGVVSTDKVVGPQQAVQRTIQEEISQSSDRFYDISDTQFYDDVIATPYSHPFPDMPLERAVRELLVVKEPITAARNNRGVRNITFGGNFYYDSASTSKDASRDFLSQWHKFCLFGPKRRPWTREEMEEVGKGTTTDGPYAPNRIRLWFLLPKEGTGPKNLVDLSSASMQVSHSVDWTNRLEVLQALVEPVDYCLQVTPCGDIIVEFTMADFRPEDFGEEFKETFRVHKALKTTSISDEQEAPPAGLILSYGFGRAAGQHDAVAQASLTKVFVYSPYIAARYGIEIETDSIPFLTTKDRVVAQQRAVIMYQRRLARSHALNFTFSYRPFILPNRPMHHLRRGRMGVVVTCEKSLTLSATPAATVSCGLEHVRLFSGYYRSSSDFAKISDLQRKDLSTKGIDPNDVELLQGIDSNDGADPYERQVFTTVAAGESTPTSARVGWGPQSVLAPASGVYVLDLQAVRATVIGNVVPAPADGQQAPGQAVTSTARPTVDNTVTFPSNPLAEMVVTAPFGQSRTREGRLENHKGTDLHAALGTPFYAVAAGTITRVENTTDGRTGLLVALRTENHIVQYLHCDPSTFGIVPPVGRAVVAGQQIGFTGNTPGIYKPHLHIQVFKIPERLLKTGGDISGDNRGAALDIMPLLPQSRIARND